MRTRLRIAMFLTGSVFLGMPLRAATELEKPAPAKPAPVKAQANSQDQSTTEATIDKIMDQAVRNIGRRYNLNEAQIKETDKLMKRDVRRFLKEHEKEIWPLIRVLLDVQLKGGPPENPEDVKRIGTAAKPLAKLAQEAIVQANMEWRQYLTVDQQRMHDFDMQEMQKTFTQINKNFGDWEAGTPADGPIIPAAEAVSGPVKPKQPPPGLPGPERRFLDPDVFEVIVEKFIKDYELDQGQIDAARSMLEETKVKAVDFQNANKTELEALARRQDAARANRNHDELTAVDVERKKLLEPYHAMVFELETRLKALLTTAQIEKYAQRQQSSQSGKSAKSGATMPAPQVKKKTAVKEGAANPPPAAAPPGGQPNPTPSTAPAADPPKADPPKEEKPQSDSP